MRAVYQYYTLVNGKLAIVHNKEIQFTVTPLGKIANVLRKMGEQDFLFVGIKGDRKDMTFRIANQ